MAHPIKFYHSPIHSEGDDCPQMAEHPTVKRLTRMLDRVHYKRGELHHWEVMLDDAALLYSVPTTAVSFRPVFKVDSVVGRGERISLYAAPITIREEYPDDQILHLIRKSIQEFEFHEMDEHLFVDGNKLWDPHRSDRVDATVRRRLKEKMKAVNV